MAPVKSFLHYISLGICENVLLEHILKATLHFYGFNKKQSITWVNKKKVKKARFFYITSY